MFGADDFGSLIFASHEAEPFFPYTWREQCKDKTTWDIYHKLRTLPERPDEDCWRDLEGESLTPPDLFPPEET